MSKSASGALLHEIIIDRNAPTPLYRQLDAALRHMILKGTLVAGQKLPSTRELAQELGIARITVKSVYEQLVAEGFTIAKTGAGTFVADGLEIEAFAEFKRPLHGAAAPAVRISNRAQSIMSSKASVRHGKTDPFRPGVPALELFPVKLWQKYLLDATTGNHRRNLSYGEINGSSALQASIARHLADARSMDVDPAQIIITSGAQQAFVLIALVLLNKGDTVWYENPGHIAGRDVMQVMGSNVVPVPIDNEGLDLKFAIENLPKPSLIFTTPSHQQPLGTTMSLVRRLALLTYAKENDVWIIEDDYDSEFRYNGRPLPALSALDAERRVFYVGTFAKSMFAAIRLGYVVVPPELVEPFSQARNLLGQGSSAVVEHAMSQFMDDGRFVEHIRKMRRVYRERRDILFDSLKADCSDFLVPQPTDAGMHMVAWLKNGMGDVPAHDALLKAGIESLPLSVYCQSPINRSALVLGFSCARQNRIRKVVRRMSLALGTV